MRQLGQPSEIKADLEPTHAPVTEEAKRRSCSFFQHNVEGDEQGSTNVLEGQGALPDTYWARELDVGLDEWNKYLRGEMPDGGVFIGIPCLCWNMLCCLTNCSRGKPDVEQACRKNSRGRARKGILHMTTWAPSSRVCRTWTFIMGSIDLWYTAFLMPVLIVFPTNQSNYIWGAVINLIFGGAFYWIDIVMRFRTGFCVSYNLKRELIMDGGLIAHFYMRHDTFATDLIAALPSVAELVWVCLHGTDYGLPRHIILLLRLARMRCVFTLIKGMLTMTMTGQYSRRLFRGLSVGHVFMLMLTYITFWLLNLMGCSWVWLAGIEGKENSWMQTVGNQLDISSKPPARQWIGAVYFAVTLVTTAGLGDIKPCTPAEEVLASFDMLLGVFLFGLIISTSQSVLAMLSDNARTMGPLRQKLQYVEVWLRRRHLSDQLARRIRAYYTEIWAAHRDLEHDNFYGELPKAMRADVAAEIVKEVFDESCFLSVLHDRARRSLCERLRPYSLPAGHAACQEGDQADTVWLLTEGEMLASRREKKEEYLAAPAILGETSILAGCLQELATRPSTIEAVAPCTLWTLQVKDLETLVDLYPDLAHPLQQGFHRHLQNHLKRTPGHKWAHILKRYAALPDDKKPFAAPARRRHIAKTNSMDKGKAKLQDEDHSDLDSESADSHEEMVSVLPDEPGQRPSASWGTEDSARAGQRYSQTPPAQTMYTEAPQPPLEWQR